MIRYASRTVIDRPVAEVFAALLDPARYGLWTDMVDVAFDPGPPGVGSRGQFRLAKGPIKGPLRTTIEELVPDRRVVFRIDHPALAWRSISEVEPDGDGTCLHYGGEVRLRGWRRLLEPLLAGEVRSEEQREALRLKALLEGEPRPDAAIAAEGDAFGHPAS